MSTGHPLDPRLNAFGTASVPGSSVDSSGQDAFELGSSSSSAGPDDGVLDPQLVQQTKNQIRQIVNEIANLAQADISLDDFYEGFLTRVVSAMASVGGAVWTLDEDNSLQLQYQINLPQTRLGSSKDAETRHGLLLKKVLTTGQPIVMPPRAGSAGDDEAGNPTEFLLVLATFHLEQNVQGIIEIFQRPGAGPTTQRGYQRFVVQMCDIVSEFLKNRRLRQFNERQELWEKLEQFTGAVHRTLDVRQTAFTIANDGRQFLHADRVSIALMRGKRCRVEVVSGLDTIERRAEEVTRLSELATAVVSAKRPLWYGRDTRDLPPQIEDKLHAYIDRGHSKSIAVLPLFCPSEPGAKIENEHREPLGALIVEQLADDRISESLRHRTEAVVLHSSAALANATAHQSLFLLPLWEMLGRARWVTKARTWPRTFTIFACVVATALALYLVPMELKVASRGKLQPVERHEIFALTDGIVTEVPIQHGQMVEPQQLLVKMRSDELDNEVLTLLERQSTTKEQIASKQRALINMRGKNLADENLIAGELAQLTQAAESIEKQLTLFREKQKNLELHSENRGQVVSWQVREQLLKRPVQKGQVLMNIANPDGPWELELYIPERHMGHIAKAAAATSLVEPKLSVDWRGRKVSPLKVPADGMKVSFQLSTHPDREFVGRVVEIHRTAEVRGEDGNTLLVRVAIDKSELPELYNETTVQARVHCGPRASGFVLFRDLIETVQSFVLFYL